MLKKKRALATSLGLSLAIVSGTAGYWLWSESQAPTAACSLKTASTRTTMPPSENGLPATQTPQPDETSAPNSPLEAETGPEPLSEPSLADSEAGQKRSSITLVNFAHQLAELMEHAMESEKDALPAFAELEQCARDQERKEVIQARLICFANASKLSKEYPSVLGSRFKTLALQNPKLVGLLQTTGLE